MKFDPILFLTIMLIPLTMIGFGFYFFKRGPQTINGFFGYRTSRSMKNQDTWRFAHKHCGRIWMIWGTVLLAASTAAFLYGSLASHPLFSITDDHIFFLQVLVLILSILPTEVALRKILIKTETAVMLQEKSAAGNPKWHCPYQLYYKEKG